MSKYQKRTPEQKKALRGEIAAERMASRLLDDLFEKLGSEGKQRIIGASFGEVGTLKTSFWLTAPGPILLQSLDRGTEGVVDVYLKKLENEGREKDIYHVKYDPNTHLLAGEDDGQAVAEEMAAKIEKDFEVAIANGIRTIIWDKETQIYEIFKYAQFGSPSDQPSNYYQLFQRYRALINKAKDSDINFGVIQGMKTPWVSEMKNSGKIGAKPSKTERVRRGMPEIDELMHLNIEHIIDEDGDFAMKVGKVRGPGARGIQNKTIGYVEFPEFATLVFPETEEGDWL
jgi:hypothetical protein